MGRVGAVVLSLAAIGVIATLLWYGMSYLMMAANRSLDRRKAKWERELRLEERKLDEADERAADPRLR